MVALLDDVFRLFGATMLQLGDMQQPFDARNDLDEGAECRRALHHALVDLPYLGLLHEPGYHVSGPLCRLTHARNRDHTRILHVDLGTRLLLDTADRLALGTDEVADLVGPDLNREDARRVLGELCAWLWHRLLHNVQDVQARLLGLVERFANHLPVELLDLDVHPERVGELLVLRQHRLQRPFAKGAVADLTARDATHWLHFSRRERGEVVV